MKATHTLWVRLFAQWDYFAPRSTSLNNPNDSQFVAMQKGLDTDIKAAKSITGQKVILTTRGFPGTSATPPPRGAWIPDEGPQPNNQYSFPQPQYLMPSVSPTPPALDGPYAQWLMYLMDRYHPSNPNPPVRGASIDYLEVVNEPNQEIGPGSAAVHATALMFNTAHSAAVSVNAKYPGQPIRLLGPATADSRIPPSPQQGYKAFTEALLDELQALPGVGFHSKIFGWSHHNYRAVEHIAFALTGMSAGMITALVDVSRRIHQSSPNTITPMDKFYGGSTQNVRNILRGRWFGWGTSGQNPQLWLTEGGARLGTEWVHGDKQLQAVAVGAAAEVLGTHRGGTASLAEPGQGVEMFTNFLFYSERGNDSGLRNPAPGGAKRPVYGSWTQFKYPGG
ncbi:MAG: hypothetical protein M3065_01600 [Actinomycetota bacterium]|nr:hypothetical protein [Actinomycetota bacterium]